MTTSRKRPVYVCRDCGYESPRWMGFCPACSEHAPLVEMPARPHSAPRGWLKTTTSEPQELSQVSSDQHSRISLGFDELNRVLGGGVVPGSVVLIAGEPGAGKSTLLLQTAQFVSSAGSSVLYVTGEESSHQIKLRSERLGLSGNRIHLLAETDMDVVLEQLERFRPGIAMVDSIQTLYAGEASSGPGSVAQVRECAIKLTRWAKASAVPVLISGHVTKDGTVAGPRVLEHMVDVVIYLEGEELSGYHILRSVKNRFGSTNDVGIFEMGGHGLAEVPDPSRVLLSQYREEAVGSTIVPVLEGSRPLLVEVQALTSPSVLAVPRRVANGVDYNRLLLLTAVLTRRAGLNLSGQDIIVNVAGGLKVREPATDLAVAAAIASCLRDTPLHPGTVAIGEVGLSGELRAVPQIQRRLGEASRLGFRRCVLPQQAGQQNGEIGEMEIIQASTLSQALRECLPGRGSRQPASALVEADE